MFKKLLMTAAFLGMSATAQAAGDTRILYLGIDEGKGLLEKETPAFQRVFNHTGNYLHHQGISVMEEAGDKADHVHSFGDAMDVISQIKRRKFDAVVVVSVRHVQKDKGQKIKDRLIATAKIIDPRSLEVVDTISQKSPVARLQRGECGRGCQKMIMRRHVREVLPDFKDDLLEKLQTYEPRKSVVKKKAAPSASRVTLTLKGFSPREVRHIENRVADLDSTKDLSWLTSNSNKPAFWLERRAKAGDITTDLSTVLSDLDLSARIVKTPRYITLIKVQPDVAFLD